MVINIKIYNVNKVRQIIHSCLGQELFKLQIYEWEGNMNQIYL